MSEPTTTRQLSLSLAQPTTCVVCGKAYEVTRQRGRPQLFCGPACRRIQHRAQIVSWAKKQQGEKS